LIIKKRSWETIKIKSVINGSMTLENPIYGLWGTILEGWGFYIDDV
jgi:hypothetical protein